MIHEMDTVLASAAVQCRYLSVSGTNKKLCPPLQEASLPSLQSLFKKVLPRIISALSKVTALRFSIIPGR